MRTMFNKLRQQRGQSITDISKLTGLSRTTLTALDKGTSSRIDFDTLHVLTNVLECTPNDFFGYYPGGKFNHIMTDVWAGDFDKRLGNPENTILQVIPTNEDYKFHVVYSNRRPNPEALR